jgi:hypothetical protein
MTTAEFAGREWTLHGAYRRARWGWKGLVYWNPPFVDSFLDGVPSRLAYTGYALTERGMRQKMARALRAQRRKYEDKDWIVAGRKRTMAA